MRFFANMEAMAPRENMLLESASLGPGAAGLGWEGCTLRRVTPLLISSINFVLRESPASAPLASGFFLVDFLMSVNTVLATVQHSHVESIVPSFPDSFLKTGGGGGGGGRPGGPLATGGRGGPELVSAITH